VWLSHPESLRRRRPSPGLSCQGGRRCRSGPWRGRPWTASHSTACRRRVPRGGQPATELVRCVGGPRQWMVLMPAARPASGLMERGWPWWCRTAEGEKAMSVGKVDAASGCGMHGASIGFVVILHHRSVGLRLIKCGPRDWLQSPRHPLISDRGSMQVRAVECCQA